jgi:hypothetical protein
VLPQRLVRRRSAIELKDFIRGFAALQQIEYLSYPLGFAPQFGFINCCQQYGVYHLVYFLKFRISFIQIII